MPCARAHVNQGDAITSRLSCVRACLLSAFEVTPREDRGHSTRSRSGLVADSEEPQLARHAAPDPRSHQGPRRPEGALRLHRRALRRLRDEVCVCDEEHAAAERKEPACPDAQERPAHRQVRGRLTLKSEASAARHARTVAEDTQCMPQRGRRPRLRGRELRKGHSAKPPPQGISAKAKSEKIRS